MPSYALGTSDAHLVRWLDLVVLALALPLFLATGLPLLGWGAAAGIWLLQRGVQALISRRARASDDPRAGTALLALSMITRVWLIALAVFAAGMVEREAGLSAAVLSIALVTSYLTATMIAGPFAAPGARR